MIQLNPPRNTAEVCTPSKSTTTVT
jgi:hypothetical protein